MTPGQVFDSIGPETSVSNLFLCGHWMDFGGVSSVMLHGDIAAKYADKFIRRSK